MSDEFFIAVVDGPGPKWKRTSIVYRRSVFFPGSVWFASDMVAMLCAAHDGAKFVKFDGRVYVDADFCAKEFPFYRDQIRSVKKKILAPL